MSLTPSAELGGQLLSDVTRIDNVPLSWDGDVMAGSVAMVVVSTDELRAIVAEVVAATVHACLGRPAEPRAVRLPGADGAVCAKPTKPSETAVEAYRMRLQRERLVRGWTQQQVVDRVKRLAFEAGYGRSLDGLDVNALSRLENGRILRPRAPLPELFAALYGLPLAALFPARATSTGHRRRKSRRATVAELRPIA